MFGEFSDGVNACRALLLVTADDLRGLSGESRRRAALVAEMLELFASAFSKLRPDDGSRRVILGETTKN